MTTTRQTPVHAVLITHTPERLRRTILGIAASSHAPDSVTLSCDSDARSIADAARSAVSEAGLPLTLVMRPIGGDGRASQTRNNAVRVILRDDPGDDAVLVFFDGDCVPLHRTIERHARALEPTGRRGSGRSAGRAHLSLGWRYDLDEAQDAGFDEEALARGGMPFQPTREQAGAIRQRHRRYRRQLFQRALGLAMPHKPKLLSANFACTLAAYRTVNGFDEAFVGWGQEDDDFGRRLHQARMRVHIGIRDILACHQHHVTRAPGNWHDSPNVQMLHDARPTHCRLGLDSPAEQPTPEIIRIDP